MWGRNQINIPEPVQSAFVPNAFRVASARRGERKWRESRPGDETSSMLNVDRKLYSNICKGLLMHNIFI